MYTRNGKIVQKAQSVRSSVQERRSDFDVGYTQAVVTQALKVKYKMLRTEKRIVFKEKETGVALGTG